MKILAIDPGTHCGWCTNATGRLEWGEQDFSLRRGESPGMRYIAFRKWLLCMPRTDLVVFERPHMRGGAATDLLVGFSTRIEGVCAEYGIEHAAVHSATLKKFALGRGRGDKKEMIAAAVKRLGFSPKVGTGLDGRAHWIGEPCERAGAPIFTDKEADALWLYWWADSLARRKP